MIKEKDIIVRVDYKLKAEIKLRADLLGLSVSAYIRMILIKEMNSNE